MIASRSLQSKRINTYLRKKVACPIQPCVKVVKVDPKIRSKTSKKVPLAQTIQKQGEDGNKSEFSGGVLPSTSQKGYPKGSKCLPQASPWSQKELQMPSRSIPGDHRRAQNRLNKTRAQKKSNFPGRHSRQSRQRRSKKHPKTAPRDAWKHLGRLRKSYWNRVRKREHSKTNF